MGTLSKITARAKKASANASDKNSVSRICFLKWPKYQRARKAIYSVGKKYGEINVLRIGEKHGKINKLRENAMHLKEIIKQK